LTIAWFALFRLKIKLVQAAVLVKGKGAGKQVKLKAEVKKQHFLYLCLHLILTLV